MTPRQGRKASNSVSMLSFCLDVFFFWALVVGQTDGCCYNRWVPRAVWTRNSSHGGRILDFGSYSSLSSFLSFFPFFWEMDDDVLHRLARLLGWFIINTIWLVVVVSYVCECCIEEHACRYMLDNLCYTCTHTYVYVYAGGTVNNRVLL